MLSASFWFSEQEVSVSRDILGGVVVGCVFVAAIAGTVAAEIAMLVMRIYPMYTPLLLHLLRRKDTKVVGSRSAVDLVSRMCLEPVMRGWLFPTIVLGEGELFWRISNECQQ